MMIADWSPFHRPADLIASLKRQVRQSASDSPSRTLVVACTDTRLDRHVVPALTDSHGLLLRVPGPRVQPRDDDHGVWQAIAYAITELNVQHLILCSHSHAAAAEDNLVASDDTRRPKKGRILQHLVAAQHGIDAAKLQLSHQFDWLAEQPLIAERVAADRLGVLGLFYLVESGLFLAYEPSTQRFAPLARVGAAG